jgi:hypothetical protein
MSVSGSLFDRCAGLLLFIVAVVGSSSGMWYSVGFFFITGSRLTFVENLITVLYLKPLGIGSDTPELGALNGFLVDVAGRAV